MVTMTKTLNPSKEPQEAQETPNRPLLAEVEDLGFKEACNRLVGSADEKGDLYLGSGNAYEAATETEGTSQFEALARILVGENVFIAGAPGTGKSSIVHLACRVFDMQGIQYEVVAPTGAAAENIKGTTIHSLFGVGKNKTWDKYTGKASYAFNKTDRLKEIDVLIVDEVSMVYGQLWQEMDEHLRRVKSKPSQAFGGIQIVVVGDFNQLKAVPDRDFGAQEHYDGFPFSTPAWVDANFHYCFLTKAHRATDPVLSRILRHMSANALTAEDFEALTSRTVKPEDANGLDDDSKPGAEPIIRLYTQNSKVTAYNDERIQRLPGDSITFASEAELLVAEDSLTPTQRGQWKSIQERAKLKVSLKPDTKVVADMPTIGYYIGEAASLKPKSSFSYNPDDGVKITNGTMGYVRAFASTTPSAKKGRYYTKVEDVPHPKTASPVVQFGEGLYLILRMESELERPVQKKDEKWTSEPFAYSLMFPLKAGYAVTVHKSQGQTYDGAILDLNDSFTEGLGYVALSRVRTLDTAFILTSNSKPLNANSKAWRVDAESVSIMASIRAWAADDTRSFREKIDDYDTAYKSVVILGSRNVTPIDTPPKRVPVAAESPRVDTAQAPSASSPAPVSMEGKKLVDRNLLNRGWMTCQRLLALDITGEYKERLEYVKSTGDADAMVSLMLDFLDLQVELAEIPTGE